MSWDGDQQERLGQCVYEALTHAKKRFEVLSGRDCLALQMEFLEWLSGDWKEMEVEWMEREV